MPAMFATYQREMTRTPNRRRRLKLLSSYAPDWIITILLAVIFFSLDKVDGFRREFSVADTSLRHPFALHERVPNWALYILCFGAPMLLQPLINFFTVRSLWDLHNSTLGLVLGLSLTGAITQIVKITVGRPRPDVISRCMPPLGTVDPAFGLTAASVCTTTNVAVLRDGFRSFPSGHSSLSFAGLGFLAFYLSGKMHLFDERGHAGKAWLSLAPVCGAALIAISRTMDYRHHWQDVLVGSLLGLIMAFFAYRQYYPSLSSPYSHRPFSPRIAKPLIPDDTLPTVNPLSQHLHPHIQVHSVDPDRDRASEDSDSSQRKLTATRPPLPRVGSLSRHDMAKTAAEGMGSRQGSPNNALKGNGNGRYEDYSTEHEHVEDVELAGTVIRKDLDLSDLYDREEREERERERAGREGDSLV